MTTLVTGASGLLGTNLVRALIERGQSVRVLLRRDSDNAHIEALDVGRVYGDMQDRRLLEEAVQGCQRVYHLASIINIRYGDEQNLFDVNVLGARRLFEAALKGGVERAVYCSSFGAIGMNPDGPSSEEWIASPFEDLSAYHLTKIFAEHEALRAAVRGLHVTIVNPSGLVGPWDYRPSMLGQTIIDFCRGRMKAYVPGAFDFVPVRDVVQGLQAAMERGRVGERYLLTGEFVSLDEILRWLSEITGRPGPRIRIPFQVMKRIARVKDWGQKTFFPGSVPRFTYHSIRILNSRKYGDHTKARQELGFQPTSVREAFREAVEWFQAHGYVKKPEH